MESLVAPGIGHISDRTPCNVDAIIPSRKWAIAIALHALERSLPKHISIRHQHLHSFRETDATRLLNFCTSSVSFPFTPSRCRGQIPLRLLGLIMMITRARTDNEKNITPGFTFLGAAREPEVRIAALCTNKHATGAETGGVSYHTLPVWNRAFAVFDNEAAKRLQEQIIDVTSTARMLQDTSRLGRVRDKERPQDDRWTRSRPAAPFRNQNDLS